MPTIVVGGAARNIGKTSLICALIAALPECRWTAVKITSHDYAKPKPIWEETEAGQGSDTARYLTAGAYRALLVTACDGEIPLAELRAALADAPWLIFETNQIQSLHQPDIVLALVGSKETERKPSFAAVVQHADAFVCTSESCCTAPNTDPRPVFLQPDFQHVSPELSQWLRARLGLPKSAR